MATATIIAPNTVSESLKYEVFTVWDALNDVNDAIPGETLEKAISHYGHIEEESSWVQALINWRAQLYVDCEAIEPQAMVESILVNDTLFERPGYLQKFVKALISIPEGLAALAAGIRAVGESGLSSISEEGMLPRIELFAQLFVQEIGDDAESRRLIRQG
jgi:hypothetical protein